MHSACKPVSLAGINAETSISHELAFACVITYPIYSSCFLLHALSASKTSSNVFVRQLKCVYAGAQKLCTNQPSQWRFSAFSVLPTRCEQSKIPPVTVQRFNSESVQSMRRRVTVKPVRSSACVLNMTPLRCTDLVHTLSKAQQRTHHHANHPLYQSMVIRFVQRHSDTGAAVYPCNCTKPIKVHDVQWASSPHL